MIALGALYLFDAVSGKQALLFLVGTGAGLVLYFAAFGFASSWRALVVDARGAGVRAQMLMLALTSMVFFPVLASGHFFGQAVRGSVSPIGIGVLVGAFLFGVGMQLGGGCASGTLYTAGGGDLRMLVTLVAFIAGAVVGAAQSVWWETLPSLKPISLVTNYGAIGGLAISLTLFAAIALFTLWIERRRHGSTTVPGARNAQWPLVAGAIGLAVVNILTLAIAGRPWGVTGAFTLWGAKALAALGVAVEQWKYFAPAARRAELHASVLADGTSVMNFGIAVGALLASAIAGRFATSRRITPGMLAASLVGGLMLGYGSRIAYGCNIGAYFSGIASGSVHGWVWFPAALAGNVLGARLRPVFGFSRR